ncbi:MAG: YqgE/AlgH family protein, partial [Phycisphaerales bacterium]|nr:YqgE/AlgH family protein [Phycisphaerales bacterium]
MAPDAFLRRILGCAALFAAVAIAATAAAQEHSRTLLLVARPGLPDPNFRETVVLVTQDEKANAVGLIVN